MSIDDRLIELSIDLPSPMNTAKLPFQLAKIDGTTMFLAGHVPTDQNGNVAKPLGKVGDEIGPEEAYQIARQAALGLLATCLLYTSPSPRDLSTSRMPSSA